MPDPVPPPSPAEPCSDTTKELKVFWQIPLQKDTSNCVGSTGISFGDKIGFVDVKSKAVLKVYDAMNGHFVWQYSIWPNNFGDKDLAWGTWRNQLVLHSYYNKHILNQQNGQLIANTNMPSGNGAYRMLISGNSLYQNGGTNQFADSVAYVMRLQLETLRWDTVYALRRKDHFDAMGFVESPVSGINASLDSILYFKFRTLNGLYFYAYNMTQKRVEWRKDSLDYDGSVYPPIVENDRVYVDGLGTIYCLDANTGQQIWARYVGSRLVGGTRLFLYKDLLATISLGGKLIVLDKNTGNWLYNYQDDRNGAYDLASPSSAVVHNGVMYVMAGGYFYGLDLETGKILGKYRSPNRCKYGALFGYGGISANAVTNCIYVDDEYFLMAIKAFK
jgi:hypothetical protein